MSFILIIINILFTAIGQILLKYAAISNKKSFLICGYFLFVLVVIDSYFLMKYIELKYFTLIMTLSYLAVFSFSSWIFKEKINNMKVSGIIFVVAGVIVFSFGK